MHITIEGFLLCSSSRSSSFKTAEEYRNVFEELGRISIQKLHVFNFVWYIKLHIISAKVSAYHMIEF